VITEQIIKRRKGKERKGKEGNGNGKTKRRQKGIVITYDTTLSAEGWRENKYFE
jgi:hypothetical protein